jgi:hypothetical protein
LNLEYIQEYNHFSHIKEVKSDDGKRKAKKSYATRPKRVLLARHKAITCLARIRKGADSRNDE